MLVLTVQLCPPLCDPMVACYAPLSMRSLRQESWSGLSFPTLGHLPDLGIEPISLMFPAFIGSFFTTEPPRKPYYVIDAYYVQCACYIGNIRYSIFIYVYTKISYFYICIYKNFLSICEMLESLLSGQASHTNPSWKWHLHFVTLWLGE